MSNLLLMKGINMELQELIQRFSKTREQQEKAIFSTLFILGNRLQTIFDERIPDITLKQFMLLSLIRQVDTQMTFTQLGSMMGCSRQNVKKLAAVLERNGYVTIKKNKADVRAATIVPTPKMHDFFDTVFVNYQTELTYVFEHYSNEELQQLFQLFVRLYEGVECMEKRTKSEKA